MISKDDCLLLLTSLKKEGVNTDEQMANLIINEVVDLPLLKFINDNRPLDLSNFYEMLRMNYNQKKSKVYMNIMKEVTEDNIFDTVTTLNGYAQQVLLFSRKASNKDIFYRFSRLADVYQVLYIYSVKNDYTPAVRLLKLIKTDIKSLEMIYRNSLYRENK